MTFARDDCWVWDSWFADDGERFHLFYLHAPMSLGDPNLRHRHARIGHAVSTDLRTWMDLGPVLGPGGPAAPDATATWTGSVVRRPDGGWRMFYTGSRFLRPDAGVNVETVLAADSDDLHHWTKAPGVALSADPRWYERLADGTWREEAWRDPWIVPEPDGSGWHMLVTARASGAPAGTATSGTAPSGTDPSRNAVLDRGVIGRAFSADLDSWEAQPPLSRPGSGFGHLEVLQLVEVDGAELLVFCCDGGDLVGERAGESGGIWAVPVPGEGLFSDAQVDLGEAYRLTGEELYAGRVVRARDGGWVLLGFENTGADGEFVGRISDPLPLQRSDDGRLVAVGAGLAREGAA